MADTGEDRRDWWLLGMARAVREKARDASGPGDLSDALPAALAAVDPNEFVWIGRVDSESGRVQVRATSEVGAAELAISPGGDGEPGPTARATAEDAVITVGDLTANPEYGALREEVDVPPADAGVSVPVAVGLPGLDTVVVHIYTTGEVSGRTLREAGDVLGPVVADSYRSLAASADLKRERRRVEEVRRTVSHDFGNPLNLASGRLELAAEECESPHLTHASHGLDRIGTLTDECVSFVEAGQPVVERERRSVATLAAECWETLSTGECSLDTTAVAVEGEPERLRWLLTELLENAVDHTDGAVSVSVGPLGTGRGFYVQDTGDGIPADERAYVFDRGYTTDPDRAGQGLALARQIAGAHGWQLRLADGTAGARIEVLTDRWTSA